MSLSVYTHWRDISFFNSLLLLFSSSLPSFLICPSGDAAFDKPKRETKLSVSNMYIGRECLYGKATVYWTIKMHPVLSACVV